MTKRDIIAKIASIDAALCSGNLAPERKAQLRRSRERLEKKLYK